MTDRPGRKPRVSDEEILDVFRETDKPALPTSAVADELPIKKRGTLKRLNALRDEGRLESMDVGARSQIWYLPDDEREGDDIDLASTGPGEAAVTKRREPATAPPDDSTDESPTDDGRREDAASEAGERDADLAAAVREYLEANDLPPRTEHGRSAVIDVFRTLRERGTMSTADLQAAVHPEYADEWATERTMWNAIDRYLEAVPGIEKPGYGEWGYAGDDAVREALEADVDAAAEEADHV